jgi:hypothetical protein
MATDCLTSLAFESSLIGATSSDVGRSDTSVVDAAGPAVRVQTAWSVLGPALDLEPWSTR